MGRDKTELDRNKLLGQMEHRCRNCQDKPPKEELELHHIVPRSANGQDSHSNITLLCRDCHEAVHVDGVNAPDQTTQADFDDYEGGGTTRDWSGSNSPPDLNDFDDESE